MLRKILKLFSAKSSAKCFLAEYSFNKLVIILGNEGDRKAGIGVIKKYINKHDRHFVIVLTKFEADAERYGELHPGIELRVNSSDIEFIINLQGDLPNIQINSWLI